MEIPKIIQNDTNFQNIANYIKNYIEQNNLEQKYEQLIKSDDYRNEKKIYNLASAKEPYKYNFFYDLEDKIKKQILEFSTSKKILDIACNYLKVFPIISDISLYINIPTKMNIERANMLWHKDEFGFKSLDFFIAISEIDDENGPLYAVKTNKPIDIFQRIETKNMYEKNITGNRGKVDDNSFFSFNKDSLYKLVGKTGSTLLLDSYRSYHKGGFCKKKNRLMLRIVFATPDSIRPHNSKILNEKRLLKNNLIIDRLFKHNYLLFKLFKFKKLLKYFYRILSIHYVSK